MQLRQRAVRYRRQCNRAPPRAHRCWAGDVCRTAEDAESRSYTSCGAVFIGAIGRPAGESNDANVSFAEGFGRAPGTRLCRAPSRAPPAVGSVVALETRSAVARCRSETRPI